MTEITEQVTRDMVEACMSGPHITADTPAGRNEQRRAKVEELLHGTANPYWTQGNAHDMIMSDLVSYTGWEKEDGSI